MTNLARLPTRGQKEQFIAPRGSPLERRYYAWMHLNCTCCVTGQPTFEAAHTGGLSEGKGMGRKANVNTCLPLIKALHVRDEEARKTFWRTVGITDYRRQAAKLFDLFVAGKCPEAHIEAMQARVDQQYVAALLGQVDY